MAKNIVMKFVIFYYLSMQKITYIYIYRNNKRNYFYDAQSLEKNLLF